MGHERGGRNVMGEGKLLKGLEFSAGVRATQLKLGVNERGLGLMMC